MQDLNSLEKSALCTNFALGLEKQYKNEEANLFRMLAEYFAEQAEPSSHVQMDDLAAMVEVDLAELYPLAKEAAAKWSDRGAMRALVWSEKVTKIQKSLLSRYKTKKEELTAGIDVYVCQVCGFIYVGDSLPVVCPVCKVPNWKFDKI